MFYKLATILFVFFMSTQTAQADTVGLSWYTYHANTGPNYDIPSTSIWYGKDRLYNNKTRGLYYVKDSGTPIIGDNFIFGYYCNSYSSTERNAWVMPDGYVIRAYIQQSKCNVTTHVGKVIRLFGDNGKKSFWDISTTVELFTGYKQNLSTIRAKAFTLPVEINNKYIKMDSFIAPTLSARLGYVRVALAGKNDWHVSFEYSFE